MSWISGSRSWVMKNTSNSYLKLLLGTSMIKHRENVQYSELECLTREQAGCWSTKAVGSFIDYQYREEVALNSTWNWWDRRNAQLSTYSSLHLSLLFIPTTNFTTVLCSCWRINGNFRFKLSVSKNVLWNDFIEMSLAVVWQVHVIKLRVCLIFPTLVYLAYFIKEI